LITGFEAIWMLNRLY